MNQNKLTIAEKYNELAIASGVGICNRCRAPIQFGEPFWKSLTGKTFHVKCLSLDKKIEIDIQTNAQSQGKIIPRKFGDCEVCGAHGRIETHHIIARYRGGTDSPENLINLCKKCHDALTHTLKDPEWSMAPDLMRDRFKRIEQYIDIVNRTRPFNLELKKCSARDHYFVGDREVRPKEMLHHYYVGVKSIERKGEVAGNDK